MSNFIYGVIVGHDEHRDVSFSERGAKSYATRHNFLQVTRRHQVSWYVEIVATKVNGKWLKGDHKDI